MEYLLRIRESMQDIYSTYDVYIRPVLKFGIAIMTFLAINEEIGYMTALDNMFVIVVLSVICAILPINGIVGIGMLLIIIHCFALGLEVGAFAAVLYLAMLIMYFRFVPNDALAMIMTPAAFVFHAPVMLPLALGLVRGPLSALTIVMSVLSWKFIESVPTTIEPLLNARDTSMLDIITAMPKALVAKETILMVITFVVVFLIVAAIRKLLSENSWKIGVIVGAILYLVLTMVGGNILGVEVNVTQEIIGTVISVLLCLVLEFFIFDAKYSESEYVEFEDDNNFYYVKVIPKRKPMQTTRWVEDEEGNEVEVTVDPEDEEEDVFSGKIVEETIEQKMEGIDLEKKLEESLQSLNTNENGQQNAGNTGTFYTEPDTASRAPAEAFSPDAGAETKRL